VVVALACFRVDHYTSVAGLSLEKPAAPGEGPPARERRDGRIRGERSLLGNVIACSFGLDQATTAVYGTGKFCQLFV
jgi:hypothetical protein